VIFTSGATEANNLAILGLGPPRRRHRTPTHRQHPDRAQGHPRTPRRPPLRGFDITLVPPTPGGWVDPDAIRSALRPDTLLVSIMHVNNETGIIQPLNDIAALLADRKPYLHVDAAQGFGKDLEPLRAARIDLISISGHKIHATARHRRSNHAPPRYTGPPLTPSCAVAAKNADFAPAHSRPSHRWPRPRRTTRP